MRTAHTGGTVLSLRSRFKWMLVELSRKQAFQSFEKLVKELVSSRERHENAGDVRVMVVGSELVSEGFRPTFSEHDRSRNRIKIYSAGGSVLHEKSAYATLGFGTARVIMNVFVLSRGRSDEAEEIWVEKGLLLFRCTVGGDESGAMAFVQVLECVPPLYAVDDALESVCHRWAASGSGENETVVNRVERENSRTAAN